MALNKGLDPKTKAALLNMWSAKAQGSPSLLAAAFPFQRNFIEDPSRFKAACCTRRSGKSYGIGLYLFKEAIENPGVSVLYLALTRDSAKRIMWKDVLKKINNTFKLGSTFNETELSVKLPNGSVIYLLGANATNEEQEKLLGQKFKLVCIDEAGYFYKDLRHLIYAVLKPTVIDYEGTICMIGTPGNILKGLFFDATNGNEPGWSCHEWGASDNPHMAKKWKKEINDMLKANPLIADTPLFQQHYLGKWFVDTDALVYKFQADRNAIPALPYQTYTYVLGLDFGYRDATAFIIAAYSRHDANLYIVDAYRAKKMLISDIDAKLTYFRAKYPIAAMYCDPASAQVAAELRQRHGHPLLSADKLDKQHFQALMNSDLIAGNIKVVHYENTQPLIDEWQTLVLDPKTGKEHEKMDNHLSDACLYAWRHSRHYLATPAPKKTSGRYGEEYMDQWWEQEARRTQHITDNGNDFIENDWSDEYGV